MIQNRVGFAPVAASVQRVHLEGSVSHLSSLSAPTLSLLLLLWLRLSSIYFNQPGLPLEVAPRHMQIIKGMKEQVNLLFRPHVLCGPGL